MGDRDMQSFCQVNFLKTLLALSLLGFLLHPGRFAVLEYQLLHPLPVWPRADPAMSSYIQDKGQQSTQLIKDFKTLNFTAPLPKDYVCKAGACKADYAGEKSFAAVIIPYRNRPHHASVLLPYLHAFLQGQDRHYRIMLVEQAPGKPFNRGMLLNIGAQEARNLKPYPSCLIFHDVDLLPLEAPYDCFEKPLHLSAHLDQFRFLLPYRQLAGGVLAILTSQFQIADGFSNGFFGWGGEDDD